jgi:hypothetical protein
MAGPGIVQEAYLIRIEFFTGDYGGQQRELARVEVGLKGPDIEESVLRLVFPWNRNFRDLSILIDSTVRGMGQDLAQVAGLPPQIP